MTRVGGAVILGAAKNSVGQWGDCFGKKRLAMTGFGVFGQRLSRTK